MSDRKKPQSESRDERAARLAAALRDNLRRRKEQARARRPEPDEVRPPAEEPDKPG